MPLNTLIIGTNLFTAPGLEATPGSRQDHRVFALTTSQMLATNIFAIGILPARHILTHAILEVDAFDGAGGAGALNVGILNGYVSAPFYPGQTVGQGAVYASGNPVVTDTTTYPVLVAGQLIFSADVTDKGGGRNANPTQKFTQSIGVDLNNDRIIAAQFSTVPTTAANGNLGLVLFIDATSTPTG